MRAQAARRIRYAADCMHGSGDYEPLTEKQLSAKRKTIKRLKREYKATPYHLRDVPRECHAFVLDVKRGLTTRSSI